MRVAKAGQHLFVMAFASLFPAGLLLSGSALAQAALSTPACSIDRAIYRPLGGELWPARDYEAAHSVKKLKDANQSGLALTISSKSLARSFDFGFAFSNGYGRTHVMLDSEPPANPDSDEAREQRESAPQSIIFYFDAGLKTVEAPVKPGERAPAFLIMPDMGVKFWYGGPGDRKFIPPDGLWRLSVCRK